MNAARNLPKSLHTVSVLVNVAQFFIYSDCTLPDDAVQRALVVLRLDGMPDAYELRAAALRQLVKPTTPKVAS